MRIAISGTHAVGKSTLIGEFLRAHPEFTFEPEPYVALVEEYGEDFFSEPSFDDFYRQLEFCVGQLSKYGHGEKVIYERSPMDYLAYMLAIEDLGRERLESRFVETIRSLVCQSLNYLDLIVFVPMVDAIEVAVDEDPALRDAVDLQLAELLSTEDLGSTKLVTAEGSIGQRLKRIEEEL